MKLWSFLGGAECDGRSLAREVWRAHGPLGRAVGLLGRRSWPRARALWLNPCRAIHTFGMRFDIDAVFLDAEGRVTRVVRRLRPWRTASGGPGTASVLELAGGALPEGWPAAGARVTWASGFEAARSPGCRPR